jgi:hypothetical protein
MQWSHLVTPHSYPSALERIIRSFARQPDEQTCGASAIRHGLLLGGLSLPTSTLEALLAIRQNEGASPEAMRACLEQLGLEPREVRKPRRWGTTAFLNRFAADLAQGAFLLPCILRAEHWVLLGAWNGKHASVVDSFYEGKPGRGWTLAPGLGFFQLTADQLDQLDWAYHVLVVKPGHWTRAYKAWLPARSSLLRLKSLRGTDPTLPQMLRLGIHQFLDDADYAYRSVQLHLGPSGSTRLRAEDPGEHPVALETHGEGADQVLVLRRLGSVLRSRSAPPELVIRRAALHAGQLAG